MKAIWFVRLLFVGMSTLLVVTVASGECTGIEYYGDGNCTGSGGCRDSYPIEFCSFGCISGTCHASGSGGLCCGHQYYVPNIYLDGGECHGGNCGLSRHASRSSESRAHVELDARILQGYHPGIIKVSDTVSYKEARLIYVFDRCRHEFGPLVEDGGGIREGGI